MGSGAAASAATAAAAHRCRDGDRRVDRLRCGDRFGRRLRLPLFAEGRLDLSGVQVPEDEGGHERHREADARAGEMHERESGLEEHEGCHDDRDNSSPRLECPETRGHEQPDDPGGDGEPAPEPDSLEDGKVAERAEPVEAEELDAEEQVTEPGQRREEAEDGDEDGRVLHRSVLPGLPARTPRRATSALISANGGGRGQY